MPSYITADEVKNYARLSDEDLGYTIADELDAFINELIVSAESLVESYCNVPRGYFEAGGMSFTNQLYDYRVPVYLRYRPVLSVSTVEVNEAGYGQTPSWTTLASTDYLLNLLEGSVRLILKFPAQEFQSVRVSYMAGFSAVPETIKYVARQICSNALHVILQRKVSPIVRVDDWAVRLVLNEAFTQELKQLLNPYVRHFGGVG